MKNPFRSGYRVLSAGCLVLTVAGALRALAPNDAPSPLPPAATRPVDFAKDIQPLLEARCFSCHGPDKQKGGLRLDYGNLALKGGESGAVILPGKSAASRLLQRVVSSRKSEQMPPTGERLTADQVGLLRDWIDQGASWSESRRTWDPKATHWAFQPLVRPPVPIVSDASWARNPIDRFIQARLEKEHLAPSPEADRVALLRRVQFDLLGLPPTPDEVDAFVADKSPDAYEKLVERLLASPHYGERWARHWLDVVRFAESNGFETNLARPNAWPYRDYVIRAFNEDKPYDRFVTEQLAGDTLGVDEATGFLVGGPYDLVKSPDIGLTLQQRADELHDMVSTTGSTFLGLTVGCARCHNHKFDPIAQLDYYGMKAVFAGVQHGERPARSVDGAQRARDAEALAREIQSLQQAISAAQPLAYPVSTLILDSNPALSSRAEAAGVTVLVPRSGSEPYQAGTGRGQLNDPGDGTRLPNLGKSYSYWKAAPGRDVFTWDPKVNGRYRVWLSWGCGHAGHAPDARYVLDADGDVTTRDDQAEIARLDQRRFADGTGEPGGQSVWSGFFDAGVYEFKPQSRLILRGGAAEATVTADLVVLQAVPPGETTKATGGQPHLRAPVNRQLNSERIAPVEAKFVRFTILETNQAEPCLDELEVFSAGAQPRNVALASLGTHATASSTLPGVAIHKLEHLNDGRYGNSRSWISNEPGKGWVQLEFPEKATIDRIEWSRDRDEQGYSDRLPTKYRIEIAATPGAWRLVASSDDRLPPGFGMVAPLTAAGLGKEEAERLGQLVKRKSQLERQREELLRQALVYAGRFTAPEVTHRLERGDPMQKGEVVAPAGLAAFGPALRLSQESSDSERRLALAKWITDPRQPLTARVLVNRLWHYHFGQGIVPTPSDFGLNGGRPSHPELLDWLAAEFLAHGESIKHLQRLLVLSSTYRQSAAANPQGLATDHDVRLLWRHPPRRLEAEPLRDTILSVSGNLDQRMGGPGFDLFEPNGNYVKVYKPRQEFGPTEWRRMVYLSKPRMQLDDTFGPFDCPDAGQIAPKRHSSNTPLQALSLLNSRFAVQQAGLFAERLRREAGEEPAGQVRLAFRLALSREPSREELAAAVGLVEAHGLPACCRALLNASEFLYID